MNLLTRAIALLTITLMSLSFLFPALFSIGLTLGGGSFLLALLKSKTKLSSFLVLIFIFCLILPSILYFSSNQYNFSSAAVVTLGMLHGYALSLNYSKSNSFLNWFPLSLVILIISAKLLAGVAPHDIFPKNGGNFVSINLFGAYLSYFILSKNFTINSTHVVFLFLILILSVASQGRSGAVLASIMFLSALYNVFATPSEKFSHSLRYIIKAGYVVVISFIVVQSSLYVFTYYQETGGLEKLLDRGLYNNPREYLINEYLKLMEFESIIFGLNKFDYYQLGEYGFNLHNNYLELHSKFGLPLFVFYLYMIISILFYFIRMKSNYLFIIILAFFVRAYTDIQVIAGRFDYILFFLFFYFIVSSKKHLNAGFQIQSNNKHAVIHQVS